MSTPATAATASGSSSAPPSGGVPTASTTTASTTPTPTSASKIAKEVSHYVVTAHPPGGVLFTCKGHFVASHDGRNSADVIVAKSRRLELRTWHSSDPTSGAGTNSDNNNNANGGEKTSLFPILASVPLNGRLTSLETLRIVNCPIDFVFCTTDRHQYAVLSYDERQHPSHSQQQQQQQQQTRASSTSATSTTPSSSPYPFVTHASGRLPSGEDPNLLGRPSESGPLIAMDPQ